MPRTVGADTVYQVVTPFAVFRGQVPDVYGPDRLVLGGDPILKSHASHFAPVADRVAEQVQFATAVPPAGAPRPVKLEEQETT